jgi:hypothetical protein
MAFIPVTVTLSIPGIVKNNRVVFPDRVDALVPYLRSDDLPLPEETTVRGRGAGVYQDNQCIDRPLPPLSLKDVLRGDGTRLARQTWSIEDAGLLHFGDAMRSEKRVAKVTLQGKALNQIDHPGELPLYEALLSQETIQLHVTMGQVESVLLLQLRVVFQPEVAPTPLKRPDRT